MHFRQNDLRYFAAVVEDGQLDRAAAKLLIARSVLANAHRRARSEDGARLLTHEDERVKLTPAGRDVLEQGGTRRTGRACSVARRGRSRT